MTISIRDTHPSGWTFAPELGSIVWRKSRYSNSQGNCVEVATLPDGRIAIRDSKDPHGPALIFTKEEWDDFLKGVKAGEFDISRLAAQ